MIARQPQATPPDTLFPDTSLFRSNNKLKRDIEVVVDRLVRRDGNETRLADRFETALKLADGLADIELADGSLPPSTGSANPPPPGEGDQPKAGGGASRGMKGTGIPDNQIGRAHV